MASYFRFHVRTNTWAQNRCRGSGPGCHRPEPGVARATRNQVDFARCDRFPAGLRPLHSSTNRQDTYSWARPAGIHSAQWLGTIHGQTRQTLPCRYPHTRRCKAFGFDPSSPVPFPQTGLAAPLCRWVCRQDSATPYYIPECPAHGGLLPPIVDPGSLCLLSSTALRWVCPYTP